MAEKTATILCSGFGLGFYIPGLLINSQLNKAGIKSTAMAFEDFLLKDKKDNIGESKKSYHENFSVALTFTKIPIDIRNSIDYAAVDVLLKQWEKEDRRYFVSISGHWIYILDEYRKRMQPKEIYVDLLYVDSDYAPSWKGLRKFNPDYIERYKEVWLYNSKEMEVYFELPVSEQEIIPLSERENRLIVHGGGWGMGTYQDKIPALEDAGFSLDIVAYQEGDIKEFKKGNRYYMNDPNWSAWEKNKDGEYEFPLFSEILENTLPVYTNRKDYHLLYDVTRKDKAIIAKPGAGTLIDCLASATPLIMIEPFGVHEKRNAELWEQKGYGIQLKDWVESGYSMKTLEDIHKHIIATKKDRKNYVEDLIERIKTNNWY